MSELPAPIWNLSWVIFPEKFYLCPCRSLNAFHDTTIFTNYTSIEFFVDWQFFLVQLQLEISFIFITVHHFSLRWFFVWISSWVGKWPSENSNPPQIMSKNFESSNWLLKIAQRWSESSMSKCKIEKLFCQMYIFISENHYFPKTWVQVVTQSPKAYSLNLFNPFLTFFL